MLNNSAYTVYLRGKQDYSTGDHSESADVFDWTYTVPFKDISFEPRPTTKLVPGGNERVATGDWKVVDDGVRFLREYAKKEEPFMLYLGLDTPHPWPTHARNFLGKLVGGDSTFGTSAYYLPHINVSRITVPKWLPKDEMHPVDMWQSITKNMTGDWTRDEIIQVRQYYYAMCAELDGMVGKV